MRGDLGEEVYPRVTDTCRTDGYLAKSLLLGMHFLDQKSDQVKKLQKDSHRRRIATVGFDPTTSGL